MLHQRHPFLEGTIACMRSEDAVKGRFGVDAVDYQRVDRTIHIYLYVVAVLHVVVEKKGHIQKSGLSGSFYIFFVKGLYYFFLG